MKKISMIFVPSLVLSLLFAPTALATTTVTPQQVIRNTDTEKYQQQTVTEYETVNYQGKKSQSVIRMTDDVERTSNGLIESMKETISGQVAQIFLDNGEIYMNAGQGWSFLTATGPNYLSRTISAQAKEYQYAASKAIKGGHEFDVSPNATALQSALTTMLPPAAEATQNVGNLASVLKNATGKIVMDTEMFQKKEVARSTNATINLKLDQQLLQSLSGQSGSTTSNVYNSTSTGDSTGMPNLVIQIHIQAKYSYKKVPVKVPTGLPHN